MTITRVGTNEKYSDGWNGIFGGKPSKKAAKATPASPEKSAKKSPAKAVAAATPKPVAKKAAPKAVAIKAVAAKPTTTTKAAPAKVVKKAVAVKPVAVKAKPAAEKSVVKKAAKKK